MVRHTVRTIFARHRGPLIVGVLLIVFVVGLFVGSARNVNFWSSADLRGDHLLARMAYADAAKTYTDPDRIGIAQYRKGDFEAAAKSFARVPGADGSFNQGNAWLMHGRYDRAIASYDRALSQRPGWREAEENRSLAIARRDRIKRAATQDVQQDTNEKPDEIVFDMKGEDGAAKPIELSNEKPMSDAELQATWLRNVKTTPGDFLRAKFAFQAQRQEAKP